MLEVPISDDDPMIGEVIAGAFCLVGVVGEGGMGRVYEAEHVRLPRSYAVKIISPIFARNQEAMARFEREAQAAARIIHPNVLDVVDVVRTKDGRPCIVSELLVGEELGHLLHRRTKLPIHEAIDICRQACRGLAAAHAAGIVHRDLKPENLFVCNNEDGSVTVKLLDFGVAKMTDGASLTRTGTVVGTPAYMAPEQARGMPDVDGRADVYSLGAVLYQLVSGVPPFYGDEPAEVLLKVATEAAPPLRQIDPTVPPMLEAIIAGAMTREPNQRFGSALELESQLAAFVAEPQRPSQERAPGPSLSGALQRPTLVDPPAGMPSARPTMPEAGPPTSIWVLALVASLCALLGAVAGLGLVMTSSKKELGGSAVLLTVIFGAIVIASALALVASALRRR
jgi:eukaryotic-like serine/threonine-protein kinase